MAYTFHCAVVEYRLNLISGKYISSTTLGKDRGHIIQKAPQNFTVNKI